jgi:hypothetical protein
LILRFIGTLDFQGIAKEFAERSTEYLVFTIVPRKEFAVNTQKHCWNVSSSSVIVWVGDSIDRNRPEDVQLPKKKAANFGWGTACRRSAQTGQDGDPAESACRRRSIDRALAPYFASEQNDRQSCRPMIDLADGRRLAQTNGR